MKQMILSGLVVVLLWGLVAATAIGVVAATNVLWRAEIGYLLTVLLVLTAYAATELILRSRDPALPFEP